MPRFLQFFVLRDRLPCDRAGQALPVNTPFLIVSGLVLLLLILILLIVLLLLFLFLQLFLLPLFQEFPFLFVLSLVTFVLSVATFL